MTYQMKTISLILLFFACTCAKTQNFQLIREYNLTAQPIAFSVDPLGSVYVVFENGSLVKYDSRGTQFSFSGRKSNSSTWQIDASNPYKIIVFNRDLQIADIYNAQFSKINSIDFSVLETNDIALMCSSYDNAFWTLSYLNMELIRFSEQLSIILKTNTSLIADLKSFSPSILHESGTNLLLAQKNGQAFVFDMYGNIRIKMSEKADCWSLDKDVLYCVHSDSIKAYHIVLHENTTVLTELKNADDFIVVLPWIAVLSDKRILLYKKYNR